jgi:hypothetical protein
LTGNLKGRLGRPGLIYKDNIKMDIKERKREGVDWFHLTRDTKKRDLVNAVMIFWVSYNSGKF